MGGGVLLMRLLRRMVCRIYLVKIGYVYKNGLWLIGVATGERNELCDQIQFGNVTILLILNIVFKISEIKSYI